MAGLAVDRMGVAGEAVEVRRLDGVQIGERGPREPHRHDYHELIWLRSGEGRHLIDGEPLAALPGTLTDIGRGQVHVFERGHDLHGAVVRFGEELLPGGPSSPALPAWLLAGRGGRSVRVPAGATPRLDAVIDALAAEAARPPDARSAALQRHLLSIVLLWIERWYDETRIERPEADDEAIQLHRRFARLLETDFARHHDAAHYADALRVAPAALSRALAQVTGHATKELVTERVMVEAARLLRFTDLTVQEVAHRIGFADPLYFSRAFKRSRGEAPMAFRARARGKSMHR
jgi:AraC family transcriptional activator of pobA